MEEDIFDKMNSNINCYQAYIFGQYEVYSQMIKHGQQICGCMCIENEYLDWFVNDVSKDGFYHFSTKGKERTGVVFFKHKFLEPFLNTILSSEKDTKYGNFLRMLVFGMSVETNEKYLS